MTDYGEQFFSSRFLGLLTAKAGTPDPDVRSILQALITATISQHSCLDLADVDDQTLTRLSEYPAVGKSGAGTPVILEDRRLYLARYYHNEKRVAGQVAGRNRRVTAIDPAVLKTCLDEQFGEAAGNRQKLAAFIALTRMLAIITGGPGTGKTSTVVRLLTILRQVEPGLEVRLAAPTGKAAMRLAESIGQGGFTLDHPVQTLHRLLGVRRNGRHFRHGPDNPLRADLVIIDEASMIDLGMMQRLLDALAADTRLILLGDPMQLPSVDTGNVLADLCAGDPGFSADFIQQAEPMVGPLAAASRPHRLTDAVCQLTQSYRFSPESGIGRLAAAVTAGIDPSGLDSEDAVAFDGPGMFDNPAGEFAAYIPLLEAGETDASILHRTFEQSRILCSRRGGELGVEAINDRIEQALEAAGLKIPAEPFYHGRPVLVTRNDYNLGLYNGDIGICMAGAEPGQYLVVFPGDGGRQFLASRLPDHETCFAMTVHKSQGSEFDQVTLVLGEESSEEASSLLTRELVYTGITRARSQLKLISIPALLRTAVGRSAARVSGMTGFLQIE